MYNNKYVKEIKIGNVTVKNNVFLAPMAGWTDVPFRRILRQFGPGLTYTEMASSEAMKFGSYRTEKILKIDEGEHPSVVQIFGHDKDTICNMIKMLNENDSIDIIDINMGCPAPKIVKNGDGSGLLLDLNKIDEITKEAVKVSKKPITVKTRKGFDDDKITAVEVAKICEKNGIAAITIHGRTRKQYYSGECDLDIIKKVKENVGIPVFGNGDIVDVKSANKMFEYTKCDGILIGRGACDNPWIFKSILDGDDYIPSLDERFNLILKHISYIRQFENEKNANLKMRKYIACYLKGLKNSSSIRASINTANNLEEVTEIIKKYFSLLKKSNEEM